MSYDLYMLTPEPGVEPMDQLERMEGEGPHDPDPEGDARAHRLAAAVRAVDPRYEHENEFEFEGKRGVELTSEEGLQVTVMADHASFNFPYWDSLDAGRIIDGIARAARVIAPETGWQLYDPQLDKFVDVTTDADEIRAAFGYGVGKLADIVDQQNMSGDRQQPFWKRLLGRR